MPTHAPKRLMVATVYLHEDFQACWEALQAVRQRLWPMVLAM